MRSKSPRSPRPSKSPRSSQSSRPPKPSPANAGRQVAGRHAVEELFRVRLHSISECFVRSDWNRGSWLKVLVDQAISQRIPVRPLPAEALDKMARENQGIIAFSNETPELDWAALKTADHSALVCLDQISDPHNLGAILRTSWLLGINGVLLAQDRAVHLTPTVIRIACGGAVHVPVEVIHPFSQTLEDLKASGFWVYGLDASATQSLWDVRFPEKVVFMVGSEDAGIRKSSIHLCDELVKFPQTSNRASFNASVASALFLGEWRRQLGQRQAGGTSATRT